MVTITAEECCNALIRGWISRFGVPASLVSDRGTQFTSSMGRELNRLLGISNSTTTAYHPQANGMVERFHRQLKAALMAVASDRGWMASLPLVLLGLRSSWKQDLDSSPAELLYGEALRLPGDFAAKTAFSSPSDFASDLHARMTAIRASPASAHLRAGSEPSDDALHRFRGIQSAYVRIDASKPPLCRPYAGPFEIVSKSPKYFVLRVKGKDDKISVDRLKPAHKLSDTPPSSRKLSDINESLFRIANYSQKQSTNDGCESRTKTDKKCKITLDSKSEITDSFPTQPLISKSYKDALLSPPLSSSPYRTRSFRTSKPVSRFSP